VFALLACLTAVGVVIPAVPASATVTSITSLPGCQAITVPGTYRLDADVIVAAGTACFTLNVNDVTLLLNGHTITGENAELTAGIGTTFGTTNGKIVGPGTVTNTGNGIVLEGGNSKVRDVTVTKSGTGIIPVSGGDVRGNVVTDNEFGIVADFTGNTIIGNYAHGNSLFDLADATGNNCKNNVWRGNDFGTANLSCIH
jgi:parallel beta-helix repeat protein